MKHKHKWEGPPTKELLMSPLGSQILHQLGHFAQNASAGLGKEVVAEDFSINFCLGCLLFRIDVKCREAPKVKFRKRPDAKIPEEP